MALSLSKSVCIMMSVRTRHDTLKSGKSECRLRKTNTHTHTTTKKIKRRKKLTTMMMMKMKRRLSIYVICAHRRLYLADCSVLFDDCLPKKHIHSIFKRAVTEWHTITPLITSKVTHSIAMGDGIFAHPKSHKAIIILMAMMATGE